MSLPVWVNDLDHREAGIWTDSHCYVVFVYSEAQCAGEWDLV